MQLCMFLYQQSIKKLLIKITPIVLLYIGCLMKFYSSFSTILYENEFQNTQIFHLHAM
jgi:hypothetical protein